VRATTPATIEILSSLASGRVRADATQIQQAVLNLCTNAVHAIGDRPGRLTVSLEPVTVDERLAAEVTNLAPGPCLRLTIADTGHGMDTATLSRIFDPFFTTKEQGKGTGLGLSIVQGILAAHGGAVNVASTPGRGSSFELFFPVCADSAGASSPPTVATTPRGNQQEILIVDDEKPIAAFVSAQLRRLGYRVTAFNDPREAGAAFRAEPDRYQALVTDLTMPHQTGLDFIRELRSLGRIVPAVIITGHAGESIISESSRLARCKVLHKPFDGDDLARAVAQILAGD